jgi:hypothetical protein
VLTTRRRDAALARGERRLVEVGVFTPEEAVGYLRSVLAAAGRTGSAEELAALAADLGCLPLALSQAAAYIADAGIRTAAYRDRLARQRRTLEELSPDALPDDQAHTMAAAWSLSVEYADQLRPAGLARPMLELAALLAPNGVPAPVLTAGPALAYLTGRDGTREVTAEDAEDALRALHRVSLLTAPGPDEEGDERRVRVHQVVQRATRDALGPEHFARAARAAADALRAAWPQIERDPALGQALRTCAAALISCTRASGCLYGPGAHPVLFRAGTSLGEAGQFGAAAAHFRQVAAAAARYLGPEHRSTLTARHDHAYWTSQAGDPAGAAEALTALTDEYLRVFGPDHPHTLAARHNLARAHGRAGDAAGAAAALAELVDDHERVLGPDHPETLITRGNHAEWRGIAGDPAGAAAACAALLADRLRVLGPDHPDTLNTRHKLAHWQGRSGDAAAAVRGLGALLGDYERVVGPRHRQTLAARHSLGQWRGIAGDPAGAVRDFTALVADEERVLGPDHPDTAMARKALADWRRRAGRPS